MLTLTWNHSKLHVLIIGIDNYDSVKKLGAAVADAERVRRYLKTLGVPPDQIRYLTD